MNYIRRSKEYFKFSRSFFQTNFRLLLGMWKLTKLPQPAISIFGGSRLPLDSIYSQHAFELAKKLTYGGFSVMTGAGLGIMEAANKGSFEAAQEMGLKTSGYLGNVRMTSMGITLTSFKESNPYIHRKIALKHFFSRKWLLVRYSVGFVFFPGGYGTMDELFEVITLEQCNKMDKMPIILFNEYYWTPILDWIKTRALKENLINNEDVDLIHVVDTVDQAYSIIEKYCKNYCSMQNTFYNK